MPTIPQEISQSTQTLTDNATIVEQFAQGAANTFIPVRGGTLRPLLYWQSTFQNKVTELAQPYVEQLIQANQVADGKVQSAADSAADANQSAQEAAASAASVDFPTRLAELNAQQTRLARSLAAIGDHGQSMHMDFGLKAFALGEREGLNRTLSFAELFPDYSRVSPAVARDEEGYLYTVPEDVPAYDWDPVLQKWKLQIWGSESNDMPWSEAMEQWSLEGGSRSLNVRAAPDRKVTADRFIENEAFTGHGIAVSYTPTPGVQRTISVFGREYEGGDKRYVAIITPRSWSSDNGYRYASFDLSGEGMVTEVSSASVSAGIERYADGYFRCWLTFTPDVSTGDLLRFRCVDVPTNSLRTYAGDGVSGLYLWGMKINPGDRPGPYVPTAGSPITRAADNLGRTLGEEYQQGEGTTIIQWSTETLASPVYRRVVQYGTSNDGYRALLRGVTPNTIYVTGLNAGASAGFTNFYPVVRGEATKTGVRIGGGQISICQSGSIDSISYTPEATISTVYVGSDEAGGSHLEGHVLSVLHIPYAVSDAVFQELTT